MAIDMIGSIAQFNTGRSEQKPAVSAAAEDFLTYMKKSPAERMEDAWLRRHGMTREELNALPPEERQKILEEMRQDIARQIKEAAENAMTQRNNPL